MHYYCEGRVFHQQSRDPRSAVGHEPENDCGKILDYSLLQHDFRSPIWRSEANYQPFVQKLAGKFWGGRQPLNTETVLKCPVFPGADRAATKEAAAQAITPKGKSSLKRKDAKDENDGWLPYN